MSASPPDPVALRAEAHAAWERESRRLALPSSAELSLLAAVAIVGGGTVAGIGARLVLLFADRPFALAAVSAVGIALAVGLAGGPLAAWRRGVRRARSLAEQASRHRQPVGCPRCGAPILARDHDESGVRECGSCGATLLEARGLVVQHISEPRWRRLRWRAAARARLGSPSRPSAWSLSPLVWLAATVLSLGALWATGAGVGGAIGLPTRTFEAPLARDREVPHHGTALARDEGRPEPPPGPTTRARAPLFEGTVALARLGQSAFHRLAVIVRVEGRRAFVVYADGDSDWVGRADLLAPELAEGDAILVDDATTSSSAVLVARVGPGIEARFADGARRWVSAAVVRVRSDAVHARGRGLESPIPPGAWVEGHVGAGVWRPGIAVGSEDRRLRVSFSDGSERWLSDDDILAQELGPGARVWVDGRDAEHIVAARIGDALAIVGPDGSRGWTSLARVRRRRAP